MNIQKTLSSPSFARFESATWHFISFFPDLPKFITSFLARITPPLVVVFGILSLLSLPLAVFDLIVIASSLISAFLLLSAFKPLRQKKSFGITLLFWNAIFRAFLGLVISFSPIIILTLLLNLYLLNQIRPYFPKK